MARQRKSRKRRRRNRGRFGTFYGLFSALVIIVVILAGCIVFFKVETIDVAGNYRYSQEEIVEVTGLHTGDNLFLINRSRVSQRLITDLPYVQAVNIWRSLPSTVHITIQESRPVAALAGTGGWWLMDSDGKLLELVSDPAGIVRVTGLAPLAPSPGTLLAVDESQRIQKESLLELLGALEERDMLENAQSVDLTGSSVLVMTYDNRLEVQIPYSSDFAYKVKVLEGVMGKLEEYETGILDMTQEESTNLIPKK